MLKLLKSAKTAMKKVLKPLKSATTVKKCLKLLKSAKTAISARKKHNNMKEAYINQAKSHQKRMICLSNCQIFYQLNQINQAQDCHFFLYLHGNNCK